MAGFANLVVLDLECPDPLVLAEFYGRVLGWEVTAHQDDYVEMDGAHRPRRASVLPGAAPGHLAQLSSDSSLWIEQ